MNDIKKEVAEKLQNNASYQKTIENLSEMEQKKIKLLVNGFLTTLSDKVINPLNNLIESEKNPEELKKEIAKILQGKTISSQKKKELK